MRSDSLFLIFVLFVRTGFLNSIFWLCVIPWFKPGWFGTLALIVFLLILCNTTAARFNGITGRYESVAAKAMARRFRSRSAILVLYFAPYFLIKLAAIVILGLGLYRGAVYYSEGKFLYSYLASLAGWFLWGVALLPEKCVEKIRVAAESELDGQLTGMHRPRLGRRVELVGMILVAVAGLVTVAAGCYALYAFVFTRSLAMKWQAVLMMIFSETFALTALMLGDAGGRLKSPPVLLAGDVNWDVPTGLLVRPFSEEDAVMGARALPHTMKLVAESRLADNDWQAGAGIKDLRWLTVVRPGQHFVTPGIRRVALTNESWQWWILSAISKASLITVFLGQSGGLDWEIRRIVQDGRLERLRVLILPHNDAETRWVFFEYLCGLASLPAPDLPKLIGQPVMVWWEEGKVRSQALAYEGGLTGRFLRLVSALSAR